MGCAWSWSGASQEPSQLRAEDGQLHPVLARLGALGSRSVVVLAGAGISVSAGIPDFRSPGTGLYDNLQRFNLPYPKAVFDLDFFRSDPQPFTILAKELWPSNFSPTLTHFFVRLLHEKGLLLRHYTQNVDGLDRAAGIPPERLVEAHGSFGAGRCIDCKAEYCADFIRKTLFGNEVVYCAKCDGLVKPDIVFFGEQLPERFKELSAGDMAAAKVVVCMGTSLQVYPVAGLMKKHCGRETSRLLVNREVPQAFRRTREDMVLIGECDEQVMRVAECLGWAEELLKLRDQAVADKEVMSRKAGGVGLSWTLQPLPEGLLACSI